MVSALALFVFEKKNSPGWRIFVNIQTFQLQLTMTKATTKPRMMTAAFLSWKMRRRIFRTELLCRLLSREKIPLAHSGTMTRWTGL